MKRMGFILVIALAVIILIESPAFAQDKEEKKMPKPEKMKEKMMEKKGEKMMAKMAGMEEAKGIKIKEMKPFEYCALEMTGSYDQHEKAIATLYEEATKQGLGNEKMPFGVYMNDPENTPEKDLSWEVGLPIKEGAEVKDPLVKKKWEYPLVAAMEYNGVFGGETLGAEYFKMFKWIAMNNYTPAGPIVEKYIGMPAKNEAGELAGHIVIMIPVEKQTQEPDVPSETDVPDEPEQEQNQN